MDRLFAGGTVNAAEEGHGPPLVLLHSLLSDRASFDAIAPELKKSFRVIVPELPGFGRSQAVAGGLAAVADRMVDAVREAAAGDHVPRARQWLWRLRRAADGDPSSRRRIAIDPRRLRRGIFRTRPRSLPQHGGGLESQGPRGDHRCRDAPAVRARNFRRRIPTLMRDRREAFLKTDPAEFRAACDALATLDLRPELANVKVPTLVMVGEQDEATPPPMSRELAAGLPDARLKIIPGCAHVPQLQAPKLFLEMIGDFLPATHSATA